MVKRPRVIIRVVLRAKAGVQQVEQTRASCNQLKTMI